MTVYAWPATWRVQDMEMALVPNNRAHSSPYTQSVQVIDLLGERWRLAFTLPVRTHAEGAAVEAYLARLLGMRHEVSLWHFARPVPRGTMRGTPTLASDATQGASSFAVTTTAGATLLAGDIFGLNGQLFMVAADAMADGAGAMTVTTVNRARAAISSGAGVTWDKPTANFRMTGDSVPVVYVPGVMSAVRLEFMESWS